MQTVSRRLGGRFKREVHYEKSEFCHQVWRVCLDGDFVNLDRGKSTTLGNFRRRTPRRLHRESAHFCLKFSFCESKVLFYFSRRRFWTYKSLRKGFSFFPSAKFNKENLFTRGIETFRGRIVSGASHAREVLRYTQYVHDVSFPELLAPLIKR